jgi:hypothetical protein
MLPTALAEQQQLSIGFTATAREARAGPTSSPAAVPDCVLLALALPQPLAD